MTIWRCIRSWFGRGRPRKLAPGGDFEVLMPLWLAETGDVMVPRSVAGAYLAEMARFWRGVADRAEGEN